MAERRKAQRRDKVPGLRAKSTRRKVEEPVTSKADQLDNSYGWLAPKLARKLAEYLEQTDVLP